MRYAAPIFLWVAVIVLGCWIAYSRYSDGRRPTVTIESSEPQGMVLVDVPWEHLPDIDRFQLTDQTGQRFDTAELQGTPYVVSFFFASCPTFCRDLNKEIERINRAVKDVDVRFLTISVDLEKDTPEVLGKYAEGFGASPDRWAFLTGDLYKIKEVGEHMFNIIVDPANHTDNIFLVDKWGRYRDRFKWDQPYDMKRFAKVVKELSAEEKPPFGKTIRTRNAMAGVEPTDWNNIRWIREFHLTERSGKSFFSRQLVGEVWIASFFFSNCPGICKTQNEFLRDLRTRLGDQCPRIVSITTDPTNDQPERLRKYAEGLNVDSSDDRWLFLTGTSQLIERIGSEFFKAAASDDHHSSLFFIVDRWGDVRGQFDWQNESEVAEMIGLIKKLRNEEVPPRSVAQTRPQPVRKEAAESSEGNIENQDD